MADYKPFRLRRTRLLKDGDGLFCLPLGFRDVLLDACERLTWATTWEENNGDQAQLTDSEKQLIELGIWRLTDMCEIIINNYIEVPPTPVNVTNSNNCGGGGGGSMFTIPPLEDFNGNPINVVCLPVDPSNPNGEIETPTWDETEETAPPGWEDFNEFSNYRCIIANYAVDNFVKLVNQIDDVENAVSPIVDVLALVIAFLPTPLGKLRGAATALKWLSKLRVATETAQNLLADGEEILDYAQIITEWIQENKPEAVCIVYTMTDTFTAVQALMDSIIPLFPEEAGELYQKYYTAIFDYLESMFGDILDTMVHKRAVELIESGYQPSINCAALCGAPPALVARITGAGSGEVIHASSWRNGNPLHVVNGTAVYKLTGQPAPEYWQTPEVINDLAFAAQFGDHYGVQLNSRTAAVEGRFQGYLTSSDEIASIYVTGYHTSSSFGKIYVSIVANGEKILTDYQLATPIGYSPTSKAANLPITLPANTVCFVQLTSTAGHDEFIIEAFFSDTVYSFSTSGAG